MDPLPGPPIRPLESIEREHVEATVAAYGDVVPRWRIAAELGISERTLTRKLKKWSGSESVTRERR
jgi:DNA-binding NtrC family response regulator